MVRSYSVHINHPNHITINSPVQIHAIHIIPMEMLSHFKRRPSVKLHAYLPFPNVVELSHLKISNGCFEYRFDIIIVKKNCSVCIIKITQTVDLDMSSFAQHFIGSLFQKSHKEPIY